MKGLDLFCGAGGATKGYQLAGHWIVGVDHRPQPRYPGDAFVQADVFEVLQDLDWVRQFDFVHTSPPCQYWSQTRHIGNHNQSGKVDLLTPQLTVINDWYSDMRWIVENVERAPLEHPVHQCLMLCGSMFNLTGDGDRFQLRRHRKFRLYNITSPQPRCRHNGLRPLGVYGVAGDTIPGGGRTASSLKEGQKLMGIDWMNWRELREAIPPAYTFYLGQSLAA